MPDFKKSYIITGREVTPMETKMLRDSLAQTLVALLQNDGKVITPADAVVRDALPNSDFNLTNNNWVSGTLTANTASAMINYSLANNKYAGFWGGSTDDTNIASFVYSLRFAVGGTGGATRGRFQLERAYAEQEAVFLFADPIVYHPTETVYVEVVPRAALASPGVRLELFSLVAEPKGPFVS